MHVWETKRKWREDARLLFLASLSPVPPTFAWSHLEHEPHGSRGPGLLCTMAALEAVSQLLSLLRTGSVSQFSHFDFPTRISDCLGLSSGGGSKSQAGGQCADCRSWSGPSSGPIRYGHR